MQQLLFCLGEISPKMAAIEVLDLTKQMSTPGSSGGDAPLDLSVKKPDMDSTSPVPGPRSGPGPGPQGDGHNPAWGSHMIQRQEGGRYSPHIKSLEGSIHRHLQGIRDKPSGVYPQDLLNRPPQLPPGLTPPHPGMPHHAGVMPPSHSGLAQHGGVASHNSGLAQHGGAGGLIPQHMSSSGGARYPTPMHPANIDPSTSQHRPNIPAHPHHQMDQSHRGSAGGTAMHSMDPSGRHVAQYDSHGRPQYEQLTEPSRNQAYQMDGSQGRPRELLSETSRNQAYQMDSRPRAYSMPSRPHQYSMDNARHSQAYSQDNKGRPQQPYSIDAQGRPHYTVDTQGRPTPHSHLIDSHGRPIDSQGRPHMMSEHEDTRHQSPPEHPSPTGGGAVGGANNLSANRGARSSAHLLGNHPADDILYLKCNICSSTYGSLHSFKKHFAKVRQIQGTTNSGCEITGFFGFPAHLKTLLQSHFSDKDFRTETL